MGSFKTAWESLLLIANGHDTKRAKPGARVDRAKLRQIDLHWHDLRHEGACRLLADGVDIRIIQLMLGHASVQQTQRYLNVIDEELRNGLEVSWKRRSLRVVAGGRMADGVSHLCHAATGKVARPAGLEPLLMLAGPHPRSRASLARSLGTAAGARPLA